MGEPRPLTETEADDPLAALVRHAAGLRVEYDVEAGAARHAQRVARLEASAATSAAPGAKAWSGWGLASVVAAAAVVAGLAAGAGRDDAVRAGARERTGASAPVVAVEAPRARVELEPRGREPDRVRTEVEADVEAGAPIAREAEVVVGAAPVRARSGARPRAAASERSPSGSQQALGGDDDDRIEREAAQIRTIRAALARHDARTALDLCEAGDREHPQGVFRAERQGLRVLALVELGRVDEARPLAARYLATSPSGSLAPRIRRAIEPEGAAP